MPISPTVFTVRANQKTELGRVTYANSITLVPGTVAMDVDEDVITVHALTQAAAADLKQRRNEPPRMRCGGCVSMFIAVSAVILVAIALGLVRAFRGPTLYDRVMAANMIGTLTVLMVAVLGFMAGRPEFLDIALVYVLISFVSTIAVLRVYTSRSRACRTVIENDASATGCAELDLAFWGAPSSC